MKNLSVLFCIAVLLSAATAVAASSAGDWRTVGQAWLEPDGTTFVQRFSLSGPSERLRLHANGGAAHCLSLRANFRDDSRKVIFHGDIAKGRDVILPLDGSETSISRLFLRCSGPDNATIDISADVGRFAGEWARKPYLDPLFAAAHNWGSRLRHDWRYVGAYRFESHFGQTLIHDNATAPVAVLALMPVGIDARCIHATAHFSDGKSVALDLDRGNFLARNRYYALPLPQPRPLDSVGLDCRATDGSSVTIRVFAGA